VGFLEVITGNIGKPVSGAVEDFREDISDFSFSYSGRPRNHNHSEGSATVLDEWNFWFCENAGESFFGAFETVNFKVELGDEFFGIGLDATFVKADSHGGEGMKNLWVYWCE
jgi:hypothetical protein